MTFAVDDTGGDADGNLFRFEPEAAAFAVSPAGGGRPRLGINAVMDASDALRSAEAKLDQEAAHVVRDGDSPGEIAGEAAGLPKRRSTVEAGGAVHRRDTRYAEGARNQLAMHITVDQVGMDDVGVEAAHLPNEPEHGKRVEIGTRPDGRGPDAESG